MAVDLATVKYVITPLLESVVEQTILAMISYASGAGLSPLLGFSAVTTAWITVLLTAVVRLLAGLMSPARSGRAVFAFQRWHTAVRNLWPAARAAGYAVMPAFLFTVLWPLSGPGTLGNVFVSDAVFAAVALPVEFLILVRQERNKIAASASLSQTAEEAVLASESGETVDESTMSAAVLDAQLAYRFQRARDEADAEVRRYLPANPRTAKRMVNHFSLARAIAEQRGLFRDSGLTHKHLAKWVGLSEQWPPLGAALTVTPERMTDLEAAADLPELQKTLDTLAPGTTASAELLRRLREGDPLSAVLDRLVRFETG